MYRLTKGKLPIIGCGGVSSGEDAYRKIRAGEFTVWSDVFCLYRHHVSHSGTSLLYVIVNIGPCDLFAMKLVFVLSVGPSHCCAVSKLNCDLIAAQVLQTLLALYIMQQA